jgi:hypothetical protein
MAASGSRSRERGAKARRPTRAHKITYKKKRKRSLYV